MLLFIGDPPIAVFPTKITTLRKCWGHTAFHIHTYPCIHAHIHTNRLHILIIFNNVKTASLKWWFIWEWPRIKPTLPPAWWNIMILPYRSWQYILSSQVGSKLLVYKLSCCVTPMHPDTHSQPPLVKTRARSPGILVETSMLCWMTSNIQTFTSSSTAAALDRVHHSS